MIAPATTPHLGALGALAMGKPRGHGALAGIGDIISGIIGGVTGVISTMQTKQQSDTDRFWAGAADTKYATWLDYYTRTGEIPEANCTTNREGAPWCARAWQRFLMTVNAEQQTTLRTFATPEIIVTAILFALAVRASGRP